MTDERGSDCSVNLHGMSFVLLWAYVNIRRAVASLYTKKILASCPEVRS